MARFFESGSYYSKGVPFAALLNQTKQNDVRESSNRPNFKEDKAHQGKNGLRATLNQPTLQAYPRNGTTSMGMNNAVHSTEARGDSGTLNNSTEDGIHTNTITNDKEFTFNWKKLTRKKRLRYNMLKKEGIPLEEARKLCRLPWSILEETLLNYRRNKKTCEDPQGSANVTLKMFTGTNKQSNVAGPSKDIEPIKDAGPTKVIEPIKDMGLTKDLGSTKESHLRVGITNSKPMTEEQMKMLHRRLILAITEQCSDGTGPEFLGFSHKTGWVLVTCVNQHSKDWLVHAVPYLEPWLGAQLSIIPEQELPKPPRAITCIPSCEGVPVEQAIQLLRIQNKGLNTELWNVRCQKEEEEGITVSFTIDDASADALREQNRQAAIGFSMVTFKIKGQYKTYPPPGIPNQAPATPNQTATTSSSSKPHGSQSVSGKSFDQATTREATVPNKEGPVSVATGCQLPQAAGRGNQIAQCNQEITSWEEPAALGQQMPQTRGEFGTRPVTQNSQGYGRTLIQPSLGGPVTGWLSTSGGGVVPQAARSRDTTQLVVHDSQTGIPSQDTCESAGEEVFNRDGLATRERSYERGDSLIHNRSSFGHDKLNVINANKFASQALPARNNSSSHGGTCALDKSWGTTRDLPPLTTRGLDARSGRLPFLTQSQSREGLSECSQDGFSTVARGRHSQDDIHPSVGTLVQNGPTAMASDWHGFSGLSQPRSEYGHTLIRSSQLGRTFSQENKEETDRTSVRAAVTATQVSKAPVGSQMQVPRIRGKEDFNQGTNAIDLTASDSDEPLDQSPEEGGYKTWIIEDLESYGARVSQEPGTGVFASATVSPLAGYRDPNFAQFAKEFGTSNPEITSDKGPPLARDDYESWTIVLESNGTSSQGKRTANNRDSGLLPRPRGSQSRTVQPENNERSCQGYRVTDGETMLNRGSHEASGFGARILNAERHQDGRGIVEQESKSPRGLAHPSDCESQSSFQGSKTVTDRGSRINIGSSPQTRDCYGGRTDPDSHGKSYQNSKGNVAVPEPRSNMEPTGNYEGRSQDPGPRGPSQGSRTLIDRESRSDGRLFPMRGRIGGQKTDSNFHRTSLQFNTGRESRSNTGPLARSSYGGRLDSESHRGPLEPTTGYRDTRSDRLIRSRSPHARRGWTNEDHGRGTSSVPSRAKERDGFEGKRTEPQLKRPRMFGGDSWLLPRERVKRSDIRPR